jgi:hypothetical protein
VWFTYWHFALFKIVITKGGITMEENAPIYISGSSHDGETFNLDSLTNELLTVPDIAVSPDRGSKDGTSTLFINLLSSGAVANLAKALGNWVSADRSRTIKIQIGTNSIEATKLTHDEQQQLIEWFKTQTAMHFES